MSSFWPSRAANDGAESGKGPAPVDIADTGVADVGPSPSTSAPNPPPTRPPLQRNQAPNEPPRAPPSSQVTDSLSLAQLRRIVSEIPKQDTIAYDFQYTDTAPLAEEVDEFFTYQFWQWVRLNNAQRAFEGAWDQENAEFGWDDAAEESRTAFVQKTIGGLKSSDNATRTNAIGTLLYIALGRWSETAGLSPATSDPKLRTAATPSHLAAMKSGVQLIAELDGLSAVWDVFQQASEASWCVRIPSSIHSVFTLTHQQGWNSPDRRSTLKFRPDRRRKCKMRFWT